MWARARSQNLVVAGDPTVVVPPVRIDALGLFEASLGASAIGVTVVRTRGYISFSPTAAETLQVRVGAYVGNDSEFEAADANDNAFVDTAANRDYFLYEPFVAFPTETPNTSDVTRRMIDVKSSRKIEELNQTIFLEFSGITETATDQSLCNYDLSMLLMLP